MSLKKMMLIVLSASEMLLSTPSHAVISGTINLSALTRDSQFIIVGEITSVQDAGRFMLSWYGRLLPARKRQVTLRPVRTIKGQLRHSIVTFRFAEADVFIGLAGIRPGIFGTFFLRSDPQTGLTVTDPIHVFVVATPNPPGPQSSDLERVVGEVINVLASPKSSNDDKVSAIYALRSVKLASAREALRRATESSDVIVRLQSLATLLTQNDISQLSLAETILLRSGIDAEEYLIGNVARAVSRIKDPNALPVLTRLLDSRYSVARQSAAEAIASTGGPDAIKPLAKALYDSDHDVRYQAVRGLAMITGQDSWYPSMEWFEQDEGRFLTYWRNWAKAH